jgi:type I restriction enzyme S subunit
MKKYDSYKDSGIEWIGEIPSHWILGKIKYSDTVIMGQSPLSDDCNSDGNGLPFLQGNAEFGKLNPTPKLYCEIPNKIADINDVLLSVRAPVGALNIANQKFGIGRGLCAIRQQKSNYKYIYYWLLHSNKELDSISTGSTFKAISLDDVKNINFPSMDIYEQTTIANYLDHKTTQIEHLIAKKEQFIQLLEEERIAVINQAVTKGLDPTVPMKDSGIEWLGEIPEHWEVKRIKHTTYVKGRIGWKGLRSDEFLEFSDSYVVTGTDFDNGNVKWETCYQVPLDRYEDDPFIKLKNNDLLITKDGTIGKIAIVKDMPKIATLNSGVFLTRPQNNEYLQEYMYWILYSDVFKTFYDYNKSGSTIQHLYQNVFNEFKYTLPSLKEQTEIVKYLDKKNVEINQIKHKTQHEIELLKEYKTALISDVVTGKVDVRDEKLN